MMFSRETPLGCPMAIIGLIAVMSLGLMAYALKITKLWSRAPKIIGDLPSGRGSHLLIRDAR